MPSNDAFDVIVVGSGASGGWAAKRLTEAGVKVALVDAGRLQTDANFTEHLTPYQLQYRDKAPTVLRRTRPTQSQCYACTEYNYTWFANDIEEPYTTAEGHDYLWLGRLRVTGGRTNVWGRLSFRYSDLDFKAASWDGYGEDWPLSYKDLAPYYDIVEQYIGVTGMLEGVPELPDGHFQPPMGLTCAEMRTRAAVKQHFGRTLTQARSANLSRPLNGRAPCHYCGYCERGCITHSYFNSSFTTVSDAKATGRCTHIPNAMVYQVVMDADRNRARGVRYIDRNTREVHEVQARAVLLCAQMEESVRVLFNSATRQYPNGLANSSGVLGHYLMNHIKQGGAVGEFPDMKETAPFDRPKRPTGAYVPRFRNTPREGRSKDFLRGYGLQGGGDVHLKLHAPGFGDDYKRAMRETSVVSMGLSGYGECLPRWDNFIEIDPNLVDAFGIPVLRFHVKYGENEWAQVRDMAVASAEMLEAAGAKNIRLFTLGSLPGESNHNLGCARMGNNPKTSVLNPFQQTHDIPNLLVLDGSGFVSSPCQNPTLTLMSLAVRSTDHLIGELKRGNV